ncbi:MAG: hypothetical protein ACLP5J_15760 [Mycobacterium sp.]|uniref:hypothetical protein n=1 Tax=Mycobacterium sp. TaxID=1785 RepID=UPI003F9CFBFE
MLVDELQGVLLNLVVWRTEHDHRAREVTVQQREQALLITGPARAARTSARPRPRSLSGQPGGIVTARPAHHTRGAMERERWS